MIYRHPDRIHEGLLHILEADFKVGPPEPTPEQRQLKLPLDPPDHHVHRWYDDDGDKGMGFYCKCGAFREVNFGDPWAGKTNQEVYEMLQKDGHLKF